MSHTYKFITKEKVDVLSVVEELRKKRSEAYVIDRAPTYLIFQYGASARGIEITEEEEGYEIRMTFLSNTNDYLLCNDIVFILCEKWSGVIIDEEGDERFIGTLFYDYDISERISSEINVIKALINEGEDNLSIFGPIREFTLGPKIIEKFMSLKGDNYAIAFQLNKMVLNCQYPPEDYQPHSNFLQSFYDDGKPYYVQLLTNQKDIVVEKEDRYAIWTPETPILIEANELAPIIPSEWVLLDDYTMLAKPIALSSWDEFVERARLFQIMK